MPFSIVRNDITKIECDAIVNAANNSLLGGGGVDGAIHMAAGKGLLEECKTLGGCETGDAKITGAYNLPCKYVIHTVGPIWNGGKFGEEKLLRSCYKRSLNLAAQNNCESVAFPLISSGAYGYPKDKALCVAVEEISLFLLENEMDIIIVVYSADSLHIRQKLYADIKQYIYDNYLEEDPHESNGISCNLRSHKEKRVPLFGGKKTNGNEADKLYFETSDEAVEGYALFSQAAESSLEKELETIDESFSQMLLRMIDEKGLTDSECYKKANIDRKHFSKIRNDINYKPKKTTVIAFAIALELSLEQTRDMLMKAGFALSHSSKFDIIIEYFIKTGNYNIYEINETLFSFDQCLLGA